MKTLEQEYQESLTQTEKTINEIKEGLEYQRKVIASFDSIIDRYNETIKNLKK